MRRILLDARPSLPALAVPAAVGVCVGRPATQGPGAQILAQAFALGSFGARLAWRGQSNPANTATEPARTRISRIQASLIGTQPTAGLLTRINKIEKLNYDNSMATMHLAADVAVSAACDRTVSAAGAQLMTVSQAKDVDAYGIPPRGAPS